MHNMYIYIHLYDIDLHNTIFNRASIMYYKYETSDFKFTAIELILYLFRIPYTAFYNFYVHIINMYS